VSAGSLKTGHSKLGAVLGTGYFFTDINDVILIRRNSRTHSRRSRSGAHVLNDFTPGAIEAKFKVGDDPVTAAIGRSTPSSRKPCFAGRRLALEETVDDFSPWTSGEFGSSIPSCTREFVQGIPEFCVSIAMVENGCTVAAESAIRNRRTDSGSAIPASPTTAAAQPAR